MKLDKAIDVARSQLANRTKEDLINANATILERIETLKERIAEATKELKLREHDWQLIDDDLAYRKERNA